MTSTTLSEKVAQNTSQFRQAMTQNGFTILGENHPICPVFIGDAKLASTMAEEMLSKLKMTQIHNQSIINQSMEFLR